MCKVGTPHVCFGSVRSLFPKKHVKFEKQTYKASSCAILWNRCVP